MARAERLCHIFEGGREFMSYFRMGRDRKKVGNYCSNPNQQISFKSMLEFPNHWWS